MVVLCNAGIKKLPTRRVQSLNAFRVFFYISVTVVLCLVGCRSKDGCNP